MAATVQGTAHLYGMEGSVTNLTVTKFDDKYFAANTDSTLNETGNVIERRYDDFTHDATITGRMKAGYTIPNPGTVLTYNSVTYEVQEVTKNTVNKGYREVTITLKKSAEITPA